MPVFWLKIFSQKNKVAQSSSILPFDTQMALQFQQGHLCINVACISGCNIVCPAGVFSIRIVPLQKVAAIKKFLPHQDAPTGSCLTGAPTREYNPFIAMALGIGGGMGLRGARRDPYSIIIQFVTFCIKFLQLDKALFTEPQFQRLLKPPTVAVARNPTELYHTSGVAAFFCIVQTLILFGPWRDDKPTDPDLLRGHSLLQVSKDPPYFND